MRAWQMLAGLVAAGCARDWCGPGTIERDGQCVAQGGASPSLQCGPGTIEQDGVCTLAPEQADCGYGTVLRGEQCVSLDLQFVAIPLAAGTDVYVMQGSHGYFSHNGDSRYAIDFEVPEGTEIVAARAGRVLELREDSGTGCPDASCADQANYIVLDHGDGTFGQYWHLQQDGALVQQGQIVAAGEVIGLSGNTGWSTGPHLHFQVRDPLYQSLPLRFVDQPETDGVVFAGQTFRSGNAPQEPPDALPWSDCPEDLFAFAGVILEPGTPCAVVEGRTLGPVRGTVQVDGAQAMVATWSSLDGDWRYQCAAGPDFSLETRLPAGSFWNNTYLAISAADADCYSFQGWDRSVSLLIDP